MDVIQILFHEQWKAYWFKDLQVFLILSCEELVLTDKEICKWDDGVI